MTRCDVLFNPLRPHLIVVLIRRNPSNGIHNLPPIPLHLRTMKLLLDKEKFAIVVKRLAHQLIEHHQNFSNTVIIGIQPRGIYLADRVVSYIESYTGLQLTYGKLDITFYRDDINSNKEILFPNQTNMNFSVDGKRVVIIDDVLYTGRTIRSAFDALVDFGRPEKVELMVLIDRRYSHEFPIQADYVGLSIDSVLSQKVKVLWKEKDKKDEVVLIDNP